MHDVQDPEVVPILLGRVRHWRNLRGGHTGWGWMGGFVNSIETGAEPCTRTSDWRLKTTKNRIFIKNIGRGTIGERMVAWTIFRSKLCFGKLLDGICRAGLPEPECENTFLHDWEQSGEYQAAIFGFRIFGRQNTPPRGRRRSN